MNLSMKFLDHCAAETGYLPGPLEKVARLGEIAADVARHPFLKKSLVLKGGTALNLCFGVPKRLSVDLDYNYTGFAEREKMLKERPAVEAAVIELANRHGYRVQLSAEAFAGRKIYLTYRSALGQDDRIEVDLNFLFRIPLAPTMILPLWQPGGLDQPDVRIVSMEELLAGKFHALLERSAPRDVWDAANLPETAAAVIETPLFRALFIAISITLEHPLATYTKEHLRRCLEANGNAGQLAPMLMTGTLPAPDGLIEKAWTRIKDLLVFSKNEAEFLASAQNGELQPDLLFPLNPKLSERLALHPALLWKIANVRKYKNSQ